MQEQEIATIWGIPVGLIVLFVFLSPLLFALFLSLCIFPLRIFKELCKMWRDYDAS